MFTGIVQGKRIVDLIRPVKEGLKISVDLGDLSDQLNHMTVKVRTATRRAIKIWDDHNSTDTCNKINIIISSEGDIILLRCSTCGWDYFKKWWEFWK